MSDRTEIDLCPDCGGLRVTELTSIGTADITLDGHTGPAELWIGPSATPCDAKHIAQPVHLAREIAIDWGLIPAEPPGPTPIERAVEILRPHLAWDHRYRETP
ncbi:hypothetical protein ACIBBD_02165 [Streptomyces sp. NPDC051315]|uniref:hypothetical protein n=1 Tax=Streptomyces sp. NPDC051315 TaxID=3365650 RepID=UPI003791E2D3